MTTGLPEMNGTEMIHGGDLTGAMARFGRTRDQWLDLSTGINPLSYPVPSMPNEIWNRLPQDTDLEALKSIARQNYCIPDELSIAALPGTQSAIQALPACIGTAANVAIRTPTYGEHETVWSATGMPVRTVSDWTSLFEREVGVIVNPNNPDGTLVPPADLIASWREQAPDKLLIIDEAFADCDPHASVLPHIRDERIVVLRSFGKFFGLAGLRLGFLAGPADIVEAVTRAAGPWAVSGPALVIGAEALANQHWITRTRTELAADALKFDQILNGVGLSPQGIVPLYRLIRHENARQIHTHLAQQGIWTRIFAGQPDWLRFGVPRDDSKRDRVVQALRAL